MDSPDTPDAGPAKEWWIATDDLAQGRGEKILGPFVTRDLALRVRNLVEQNHARSYWVSALAAAPADDLREALRELNDAAKEYRQMVAGWFDFSDTDAYDELNAAIVHADRADATLGATTTGEGE